MPSKAGIPADCMKWINARGIFKVWIKVLNGHRFIGEFKSIDAAREAQKKATAEYLLKRSVSGEHRRLVKPVVGSKSGVTGVRWYPTRKRWGASIRVDGKQIYLGFFVEMTDAIAARQAANVKYGFFPDGNETEENK